MGRGTRCLNALLNEAPKAHLLASSSERPIHLANGFDTAVEFSSEHNDGFYDPDVGDDPLL